MVDAANYAKDQAEMKEKEERAARAAEAAKDSKSKEWTTEETQNLTKAI
jgi:hypothetical protein